MKRLALSALGLLILAGCNDQPKVSHTKQSRPAVDVKSVEILTEQPKAYDWIGWVEVKGDVMYGPNKSVEPVVEELRRQAAAMGANALLLMTNNKSGELPKGEIIMTGGGNYAGKPLQLPVRLKPDKGVVGQAIFVTKK